MDALRTEYAYGEKIEEFYWNGRTIFYIGNKLTGENFQEAVARLRDLEWEAGAEGREIEARQEHSRMLSEHRRFASQ